MIQAAHVIVGRCLYSAASGPRDFPRHPLEARCACVCDNRDDFPRLVILSAEGLTVERGSNTVAFPLTEILRLAGDLDPALAPPPRKGAKS